MQKRRVVLVNVRSSRKECINKDFMGGYGWAFNAGTSLPARLLNFVKKQGEMLPLMSFGYLASLFRAYGHLVDYWEADSSGRSLPKGDVALISSSMVDYRNELEWAGKFRKAGFTVGFIGIFSSARPELFLPSCDFLVRGEPEEACTRIALGTDPAGIIESNPVMDLDGLDMPDWNGFPYTRFSYLPVIREKPFFPILSSRGCAFQCGYCPYTAFYTYRTRSVDHVLEEINHLVRRYGMRGMLFRDPLFTGSRKRAADIAEAMIRKGFKIRWACETRLDLLDEELLGLLYRAGCRVINVGVESADSSLLTTVNRRLISSDQQKRIVDAADKLGIRITAFYVLGLPGETGDTIRRTIDYSQWLNTYVAQFFINTPFPGTAEYEKQKDNLVETEWERFDCYTPVLRYENLSSGELLRWKERAFVSYYYRPRYLWHYLRRTGKALLYG